MTTFANAASGTTALTERISKSSSSLFERDCAQAGLPKGSLVSPALVKIIKAQNQSLALHNAERERERVAQQPMNSTR
jgi:hypothetical protein